MEEKNHYIYLIEPSRPELVTDPDSWTEEKNWIGVDHFVYLRNAAEQGIVLLTGRSAVDDGPAMVIFTADSIEKARNFMLSDPFIRSGLMFAKLFPFRVALIGKS